MLVVVQSKCTRKSSSVLPNLEVTLTKVQVPRKVFVFPDVKSIPKHKRLEPLSSTYSTSFNA